ncbi:DUF3108 domain-containing protein [Stakelama tenebrarum]|uniref:Uncharacterized protein n=1 Tax=Stakelama tenebrarum TaxID=2711215 RepID=A0A6G6Y601_9SPHN|nr:hypothetical protein [Sphingosinithalassobacter tenebrarum]QIG80013.1 hypothetical protein G5C33_09635 [Sphingosinithalassobacter tenebrarum]
MISILLALAAPLAADPVTPVIDGTHLQEGQMCWALTHNDAPLGAMFQKIVALEMDGEPAWDIVTHQRLQGGVFDLRDHVVVRRSDLTPMAFDSIDAVKARVSGQLHMIRLRYRAGSVDGFKLAKGETSPIHAEVPDPVWDGNLWGIPFGAIVDIEEGASYRMPIYQYDDGVGQFFLDVTGSETVETPEGPIDVWLIDAGTSEDRRTTYLIAKEDGREIGTRAPGGYGSMLGGDCSGFEGYAAPAEDDAAPSAAEPEPDAATGAEAARDAAAAED